MWGSLRLAPIIFPPPPPPPPPQYIQPGDCHMLSQAELLCIDEAAAIPLPVVRALLGPYLILMASTINGSAPLPLTPSPSLPPSLTTHPLILSLLPSLPSSLPPFFTPPPPHLLTPSPPHLLTPSPPHPLTPSPPHHLTLSLLPFLSPSLPHLLTPSLPHPLTPSPLPATRGLVGLSPSSSLSS